MSEALKNAMIDKLQQVRALDKSLRDKNPTDPNFVGFEALLSGGVPTSQKRKPKRKMQPKMMSANALKTKMYAPQTELDAQMRDELGRLVQTRMPQPYESEHVLMPDHLRALGVQFDPNEAWGQLIPADSLQEHHKKWMMQKATEMDELERARQAHGLDE